MIQLERLEAIRSVHDAAIGLTLACTEAVGVLAMSVSMPTARGLGEPVPRSMLRQIQAIDDREKKQ